MKNKVLFTDVVWFQEGPGIRLNQYTSTGIKLLNVSNLTNGKIDLSTSDRYISKEEAYGKYKHFLVDENDFIIASSGIKVDYFEKKMGFVQKKDLPLCMNTSTIRFKSLNKAILDIRYFMYFLKSNEFKRQLSKQITGSAQLNFGPSHLKKMFIPLIPLLEQKKIVNILDKINSLINTQEERMKACDLLVNSRFTELCGDPISNPFKWEKKKIAEVCTKIGSGATPKGGKASYISEGISLIRSMNVHNGYFKYDELAHISEKQAKELQNVCIEENDVLLNITGASVARSCVVPNNILPARVNQHVSILRANLQILDPIFLNLVLINDNYQHYLLSVSESNGATRQALTKQQIENLVIPIPPLECQSRMACYFKRINKSKIADLITFLLKLYLKLLRLVFGLLG